MESKEFYKSKVFWINLIALIALAVQTQTGFVISAENQVIILGVVNLILRSVTKGAISFGGKVLGQS